MPFGYHKYKTLKDLASSGLDSKSYDVTEKRTAIKIAVIDDQPFVPEVNLKNYGYSVQATGDIKALSELDGYHIILCDLMGVGLHFDSEKQGATLIKEIAQKYPSSIVIAYTGSSLASEQARYAKEFADQMIKKDISNDEWVDVLDGFLKKVLDPVFVWRRLRMRLVVENLDTQDIIALENAYVASILDQDPKMTKLMQALDVLQVPIKVRKIVDGVTIQGIVALMMGA